MYAAQGFFAGRQACDTDDRVLHERLHEVGVLRRQHLRWWEPQLAARLLSRPELVFVPGRLRVEFACEYEPFPHGSSRDRVRQIAPRSPHGGEEAKAESFPVRRNKAFQRERS